MGTVSAIATLVIIVAVAALAFAVGFVFQRNKATSEMKAIRDDANHQIEDAADEE